MAVFALLTLTACERSLSREGGDETTTTRPASSSTTTTGPASTETTVAVVTQDVLDALTVQTVDVEKCIELVTVARSTGVIPYKVGALELPAPQGPRLWNDALSVPLTGTESAAMLQEAQVSICEDPLLGATWGHFFSQMEVGGYKLLDLNPWLEVFDVPEDQINDIAVGFIPLLDVRDPSNALKARAVVKNREWAELAAKLVTLMERFMLSQVESRTTILNYHLVAGGLTVASGLPEVGLNPNQESEPSLVLSVTEKGACVPIKVIGINVGDRRPVEFGVPPCIPPVVSTTTVPRPTPTTTPPHVTTTTTPPTTTVPCPSGKCDPGTTVPPSPETTVPRTTTTQPASAPTTVQAGPGATNTSVPPTTVAPPATVPNTAPPSVVPPPPPNA